MNFHTDYFSLFALPRRFTLDVSVLDEKYRSLQEKIHPDRFVQADKETQHLSLQWATQVNKAYRILKNPLSRAHYLLHLQGHDIGLTNNFSMSDAFLGEQIKWRETVFEAKNASRLDELAALDVDIKKHLAKVYEDLAHSIDGQENYDRAMDCVRQLIFFEKLQADLDDVMASLEEC